MPELPYDSALLIIDVQKGFDDPSWGSRNNLDAEANIAHLLAAWRETNRPVIHVMHDSLSPTSPLHAETPGNALKSEAQSLPEEPVYRKSVNSAFIGTTLENDLRSRKIKTLVIVGLTTNHCVSTTTRMAGNLNFNTYVVSDATATFDRIGLDGCNRSAAAVHAAALSDLHGEFATVIDTEMALNALHKAPDGYSVQIAS